MRMLTPAKARTPSGGESAAAGGTGATPARGRAGRAAVQGGPVA
jgi:hypothetical protein